MAASTCSSECSCRDNNEIVTSLCDLLSLWGDVVRAVNRSLASTVNFLCVCENLRAYHVTKQQIYHHGLEVERGHPHRQQHQHQQGWLPRLQKMSKRGQQNSPSIGSSLLLLMLVSLALRRSRLQSCLHSNKLVKPFIPSEAAYLLQSMLPALGATFCLPLSKAAETTFLETCCFFGAVFCFVFSTWEVSTSSISEHDSHAVHTYSCKINRFNDT